jgi:hypothetical protein
MLLAACDKTDPRPGDICGGTEIGAASCRDPGHMLTCRFFTWHLDACRGPDGCTRRGAASARCDQRDAREGDACNDEGERPCSVERAELLRCEGSQMVAAQKCRGRRGCHRDTADAPPSCDQGSAEVGDPCDREGSHCASDGKTVLRCASGRHYVPERTCSGPRGCRRITGPASSFLVCDVSVGDVGESCGDVKNGGAWCSRDGRQENTCRDGVLVSEATCPGGCMVRWDEDGRSYRVECEG